MDLGLQGKVALVAGASKGLGKACALGFAREGVRVAMCSRSQEAIDAAAQDVARETGAEVLALAADVSRPEACERLVQQTVDRFGRLDILVNNAGGPPTGLAAGMSDEQWQTAFETNLMSAVRLTRAAVPHMRKAGAGRIIPTSPTLPTGRQHSADHAGPAAGTACRVAPHFPGLYYYY